MKKIITTLCVCILIIIILSVFMTLIVSSWFGKVDNVQILDYSSEIYTDNEIQAAIDVAIRYFQGRFEGCTLNEITYIGDSELEKYYKYADNDGEDVIVLVSSFDVAYFGAESTFNPGSTYNNWNWILVRENGGEWKHVDHGY